MALRKAFTLSMTPLLLSNMARWSVMRGVDIWVRYGAWIYNDVTSISSGLQETSGSRKSDVKVEVRVRL